MKIGYHVVYDASFDDAIHYAAEHGFDYVQFDLNVPKFYLDDLDDAELDHIKGVAGQHEVGISFHAPGDNISLYTDYTRIRQGILEHFSMILMKAQRLNAHHLTVHAANHPTFRQSHPRHEDFSSAYASYYGQILYENLAQLAGVSDSVLVCVENAKLTSLTMGTLECLFQDEVPIYLTWDLAKTYTKHLEYDTEVDAFMRRNQSRIKEIHVHDLNTMQEKSHQTVGEGDVDFARYREIFALPDVAVTIEVRPREEALKSREVLLAVLGL